MATLLSVVQSILNDTDGDNVNSISDSVFALQVAEVVRSTYYNMIHTKDWPHLFQTFKLDAYSPSPSSYPVIMRLPSNVTKTKWIRYNKVKTGDTKNKYLEVTYLTPEEFIDLVNNYDTSKSDVSTLSMPIGGDITVAFLNDESPTYWTSFDDDYLVFNAYDSAVESSLQQAKTQAYGYVEPTWTLSDTYVIDLPPDAIPFLEAEAKSVAFATIGHAVNEKVEQVAQRNRRRLSRSNWRAHGGVNFPDYGRKRQGLTHKAKD